MARLHGEEAVSLLGAEIAAKQWLRIGFRFR
jgi:hypothetical protein